MTFPPMPAPRSLWVGLGALIVGLSLVVLLSQPTSMNARIYLAAAEVRAFDAGSLVSEIALLSIVGLWAVSAVVLLLRRTVDSLAQLVAGGIGSVLAYGASEVFKNIFTLVRPCNALDVIAECPDPGNWSFPSNHTVIAASLTVAIVFALPKAGYLAVPLAFAVGISRVFAGHHYPQDVLGGVALGLGVTVACVLLCSPAVRKLLDAILPKSQPKSP